MLSHVPFRSGEVTSLPAPMFHALGFLHATIAMMLGSTLVLRRKFKPANVLADIEKHKVTAVVVVPVMLSRILDALDGMERKPNLSSLRIVFVSGSQLGAELATRALKDLGPVIYNLYGSTEIAFATIARPKDLSINPATVGPVVKGVKVKLFDDNGNEVPQGEVGRIFVGNTFPFEGYTGGGGKAIIDGLMSSGDVGYFDEHGLLYVSGRDDEMIVSGGENVFPAEIEDLISGHPEVIEATALGVEDKEWGHRLRAFVVKAEGASVDEDAIKAYVRDHLARYKVPREVDLPRRAAAQPDGQDPQAGAARPRRVARPGRVAPASAAVSGLWGGAKRALEVGLHRLQLCTPVAASRACRLSGKLNTRVLAARGDVVVLERLVGADGQAFEELGGHVVPAEVTWGAVPAVHPEAGVVGDQLARC